MDQYIKIGALVLFLVFMLLQFKFGVKAKIIGYFFFIISSVLYVRGYDIALWIQFVIIAAILVIVLSSLFYEVNSKRLEQEKMATSKNNTYADQHRKKRK